MDMITSTVCAEHIMTHPIDNIEDARKAARELVLWVKRHHQQGYMAEFHVTFTAQRNDPRCCPAAGYAAYIALAGWREVLQGESR